MAEGDVEGVDWSFPPYPSIPGLAAAGKRFAVRYGGPGTADKHLTPAQAAELTANGMSIVANAEGAVDGLLGGFAAGASWARRAQAHFVECGMPGRRPIYLSCDFDVTSGQWPKVADALNGAASEIGADMVGIYGGLRAVQWAARDGVAAWFWQTWSWSGGVWFKGNHLEQYRNDVILAGGKVDLDRAVQPDYGQWTVGGIQGGYDMIPIPFGEGEYPGPRSSRVGAFQRALIRAGGDLAPFGGPDGRFGSGTRTVYQQVLGAVAGDGNLYDDEQYDLLMEKAYGGTGTSPVGMKVRFELPAEDISTTAVVHLPAVTAEGTIVA